MKHLAFFLSFISLTACDSKETIDKRTFKFGACENSAFSLSEPSKRTVAKRETIGSESLPESTKDNLTLNWENLPERLGTYRLKLKFRNPIARSLLGDFQIALKARRHKDQTEMRRLTPLNFDPHGPNERHGLSVAIHFDTSVSQLSAQIDGWAVKHVSSVTLEHEYLTEQEIGFGITEEDFPQGYDSKPEVSFVSRSQWALDDNSIQEPEKSPFQRIIIHHQAGFFSGDKSCGEVMRSILSLHTNDNGWSDIGYHFAICPDGRVFEGRKGGKDVVGAHVFKGNYGTAGIVFLGNYHREAGEVNEITPEAKSSVAKLIAWLSDDIGLDLENPAPFEGNLKEGETLAAVSYHGELANKLVGGKSTACPGDTIKESFFKDREAIKLALGELPNYQPSPTLASTPAEDKQCKS